MNMLHNKKIIFILVLPVRRGKRSGMKKVIAVLLSAFSFLITFGQQKPQYTQYVLNGFLLNPALAGIENYTDLKIGYRNQWQGIEGAPVTSFASVNTPLGNKFLYGSATAFGGQEDNPMNRSYKQNYMAAEPHHGIGLQLANDKTGPFSRTDMSLSYAYHLGLTEKLNVSLGISAGLSQIRIDGTKLNAENPADASLPYNSRSQVSPDAGAGLWLYGPSFFAGVSAQQLLPQKLSFARNASAENGKLEPHFFVTGGYKFFLSEEIALMPSVMAKYVRPAPLSVDLNCKLAFTEKFWVGGSYRKGDSYSAMTGFNLGHLVNISYSYDFTSSELNTITNGTHEIVLGLLLNNRYRLNCARRHF